MDTYKRLTAMFWLAALATVGALLLASPAQASDEHTFVGSVTNAPDNHCPTWARDSFQRTTIVTKTGDGQYDVRQEIDGTWVSAANAAIQGTLTGFVEYTVAGTLKADADGVVDDVDLGAVACKGDNTAPNTTGTWALRYFEPGATAGGITDWEYVYDTACTDPFVEDGLSAAVGWESFTVVCPTPSPDPSPSPEPSPSTGPTADATDDPAPGAGGGDDELAVTGFTWTGLLLPLGAVVGVIGASLMWLAHHQKRRKRITFTA